MTMLYRKRCDHGVHFNVKNIFIISLCEDAPYASINQGGLGKILEYYKNPQQLYRDSVDTHWSLKMVNKHKSLDHLCYSFL